MSQQYNHYIGGPRKDIPICVYPSNINNKHTIKFLNKLSFNGYILAGNSVANLIEDKEITGDLDFWVLNKESYKTTLDEFRDLRDFRDFRDFRIKCYNIYVSMIEIVMENFPVINLIFSNTSANETINSFDFDYCRCYYTNKTGFMAYDECLYSIFSKTINDPIYYGDIRPNRILKAIKYGYAFNYNFWQYMNCRYLKTDTKIHFIGWDCKICKLIKNVSLKCNHTSIGNLPCYVDVNDLNIQKPEKIYLSHMNPLNINENKEYIRKVLHSGGKDVIFSKHNIELPILFTFDDNSTNYEIIIMYVNDLILLNPVRQGNYMEISIFEDTQNTRDTQNTQNTQNTHIEIEENVNIYEHENVEENE